jgi:acyl-CoA synthetase (AMP-forming)/AMP-acid ligase II
MRTKGGMNIMWLTLKDLLYRNSRRYSDKLAVANGTIRYTFKEFTERCNRLANLFLSQGLEKGDRVAFLDKTCPWYLEFYYGIALGGLVGVPINYRLSPR